MEQWSITSARARAFGEWSLDPLALCGMSFESILMAEWGLPSGKLTVCYWKWPFIVDLPINSMVIFHSYVKLPEGIRYFQDPMETRSMRFHRSAIGWFAGEWMMNHSVFWSLQVIRYYRKFEVFMTFSARLDLVDLPCWLLDIGFIADEFSTVSYWIPRAFSWWWMISEAKTHRKLIARSCCDLQPWLRPRLTAEKLLFEHLKWLGLSRPRRS